MTVKELAQEMLEHFETKERDNGESFFSLKESHPNWMLTVCRDAHADMLPDDQRYRFIKSSLEIIVNHDSPSDELREHIEADSYNRDLLNWLSSHLGRANYVDDAVSEGLVDTTDFELYRALAIGQHQEREEVLSLVLASLERQVDVVM